MKKIFGIVAIVALSMVINMNTAEAKIDGGSGCIIVGDPPQDEWLSFGNPELEEEVVYGYDQNGNMTATTFCFWDCKGWSGSC